MTRPRRPEAVAQSRAVALYRAATCVVYSTTEVRPVRATPGLPDLLVFHPRSGRCWAHEVKATGGRLSPAQQRFRLVAESCGLPVVVGDDLAARRHLVAVGILAMELGAA